MEDQKSAFQLFCEENYYSETKGSKTITKAKGERIIKVLTNDPAAADYSPKFRHWVKQRGFKLVSYLPLKLHNILCLPAKVQVCSTLSFSAVVFIVNFITVALQ